MNALLIDQVKREGLVDQPAIQIFELLLNLATKPLFVKTGDREPVVPVRADIRSD